MFNYKGSYETKYSTKYGSVLLLTTQDNISNIYFFVDPHAKKPCGNNGDCDDNIDSYSCRCQPDFTGTNCETQIDDCIGIICENNGTC